MDNPKEPEGILEDYFGFGTKKIVTFVVLVAGVMVAVTGIYVAIFGLDNWTSSMQQAGSMMLSGFQTPATGGTLPAAAPQGVVMPLNAPPVRALAPPPAAAVQYGCPTCGAAGLPNWSATGIPLCPNCGSVMGVASQSGVNARLAAAP